MCGIAGILNLNNQPISPDSLRLMNQLQKHRGPDGEGIWFENNVGLGHRRLSIIDLSKNANQPMWDITKSCIIFQKEHHKLFF